MTSHSLSHNHCSAINCSNRQSKRPDLSFFRFPKNKERCQQWVQNTCRDDLLDKSPLYLNHNCHICADHFEDDQFSNKLTKNRLKWNAVPTLFNIPGYTLKTSLTSHKAMKRKKNNDSTQFALKHQTEIPSPLIDHSYSKPNTEDSCNSNVSNCHRQKTPASSSDNEASQKEGEHFKNGQHQAFQMNKEVNQHQIVSDLRVNNSTTNSHLVKPRKDNNTPRLCIPPLRKLSETPFDLNKQGDSGFQSPVQIKQEPCEEEAPLHQPFTPNLLLADNHFVTIKPSTNQISSSGPLSSELTPYSESEPAQKDFLNHSTSFSCLEEKNIKVQNVFSVPIDFSRKTEDKKHVSISRNCLKTLVSLVSCPTCQAEVNPQETIQGFKTGTLISLNLFCYNGHSIQPQQ
ncbi:THAP domain-containing protein 5-like [Octopus sinensis]|uniref:THAP domain-containing protein 5-like n=1 Tax=Octopus sinensis TaxID=2607531 RepID=A0A6P7TKU4_9MOLL|nr:THAP domain-containing protein 5-like [Octopus sinensis]